MLLIMLCSYLQVKWWVEQPATSTMPDHPRWVWLISVMQAVALMQCQHRFGLMRPLQIYVAALAVLSLCVSWHGTR